MKFDINNLSVKVDHNKQLINFQYGDDEDEYCWGIATFECEEFGERVGYTSNVSYSDFEFDVLNSSVNLSAFEESELMYCVITKSGLG